MALLVLQAAAITLIFVRGSIFQRLRASGPALWRELASCGLCAGFWVGAMWYALNTALSLDNAMQSLGAGALTSAAAILLVRVLDALEKMAE